MAAIPLSEGEQRFIKEVARTNPDSRQVIEEIHDLHRSVLSLHVSGKDGAGRNASERVCCDLLSVHIIQTHGHGFELVVRLFVREILDRKIDRLIWREKSKKWALMAEGDHLVETTALAVRFS